MQFLLNFRRSTRLAHKSKRSVRASIFIAAVLSIIGIISVRILRAAQGAASSQNSTAEAHGVDLTILDKTCKPCEDFYNYANGEWLKKNPVPAAYPSWGRFNELAERNREQLHGILESAAANANAPSGSNGQKIGDFYASCMDEKQINAAGAKPLDSEFGRIAAVSSLADLQAARRRG